MKRNALRIAALFLACSGIAQAHPVFDYLEGGTKEGDSVKRAQADRELAQAARSRVMMSFVPTPEIEVSYTRLSEPTTMKVDVGPISLPAVELPPVEVPILGSINLDPVQLPTMNLDLPEFTLSDDDIFRAAIKLTLPVYTGGQRMNLLDAADAGIEARDLALEASERGERLRVLLAYLKALQANAELELAKERAAFSQALENLAKEKKEAGALVSFDLDVSATEYANALRELQDAEGALNLAGQTLNYAAGRPLNAALSLEEIPEEWLPMPSTNDEGKRLDLEAQSKGAQAENSRADAVSSKLLPLIALQGEAGYKKGEPGFLDGSAYWQASVVLRWNLMADFSARAEADEARLTAQRASLDADLARKNAELDRVKYRRQLEDTEKALEVAQSALEVAERGVANAQKAYDLGGLAQSALIDAEQRRADQKEHVIRARYGMLQLRAALRYAEGFEPLAIVK